MSYVFTKDIIFGIFFTFSLQNTIWVDPLAEKELLEGMQTMTYTLDIGRELLSLNFAEKNPMVCSKAFVFH